MDWSAKRSLAVRGDGMDKCMAFDTSIRVLHPDAPCTLSQCASHGGRARKEKAIVHTRCRRCHSYSSSLLDDLKCFCNRKHWKLKDAYSGCVLRADSGNDSKGNAVCYMGEV